MATRKNEATVEIRPLDIREIRIRLVGDSPLIVHAWSEKAKKMMLDAQTGATKTKAREKRNPIADFANSLYWLTEQPEVETEEDFLEAMQDGAKFGFPVCAFKQAANSAAYRLGWVKNQMVLRGSYFLKSEYGNFAEIKGSVPEMREDMVRIGMGSADLRYRGEFKNWYCDMTLEYNASGEMTLEQILNVINAGGYVCGAGEWRPEKDGDFGRFHIETIPDEK